MQHTTTTTLPAGTFARIRSAVAGTPGTLRILGSVAAAAAVVFGAASFTAVSDRADALGDVRSEAAQLIRVQEIHTNLVEADANAENAFLVGGLEPPAQRQAYEDGMATAASLIAEASAHDERDAALLAKVNDQVTRYAGRVESARANNRQGYPVGVAYIRQASTILQTEILPILDELGDAANVRLADANERSRAAAGTLWAAAGITLGVFAAVQLWLAFRTRRWLSVPLVVAAGSVLVATAVGGVLMSWAQHRAEEVRNQDYSAAVALAEARIGAFNAKSAESLTLIARGSGEGYEERFQALAEDVDIELGVAASLGADRAVVTTFDIYLDNHAAIRLLDDGGHWDDAVALATADAATGVNANSTFDAFDAATGAALSERAAGIADDLDAARSPLALVRVLVLIAAALAAMAAWRAFAIRLREYR